MDYTVIIEYSQNAHGTLSEKLETLFLNAVQAQDCLETEDKNVDYCTLLQAVE